MARDPKTGSELPGTLIVVEGVDGSGKSTQIYLLKRWLEMERCKVYFSEWNSAPIVRPAVKRGKKKMLLTPLTFSLIHAIDFSDRYERQILPLLQAGYIVLCDRYIYTAFARDTTRGCSLEWVRKLYGFAAIPDITFYFKLPLDIAISRILVGRPKLKYHEAGMDLNLAADPLESFKLFQKMIVDKYDSMINEGNFQVIDAARSIENQQQIVRDTVTGNIPLERFRSKSGRVRYD
jgi:dTMP kinase